jgi:1,4-alpha-glucan branching enzyme
MIRRQTTNSGAQVKVTFSLPADGPTSAVAVVGDFNGWDPSAAPMRRRRDRRSVSVVLDAGHRYAFRYLDRAGCWFDDDNIDRYEDNGLGGANGIIDLGEPT